MARRPLSDARVRGLVEEMLIPMTVALGSVNAVAAQLSLALKERGGEGAVYPNRLHTLLSDEPAKSVNEATLDLVEQAVIALRGLGQVPSVDQSQWERITERVLARWRISHKEPREIPAIAETLSMPPAVVRRVLHRAGELNDIQHAVVAEGHVTIHGSGPALRREVPDWSFQDQAVERCLAALQRGVGRKVGAVMPTGAGKTRTALRIVLALLALLGDGAGRVFWVTHRRRLRTQARRELQRMMVSGVPGLPEDASRLLAERIDFIMLSELRSRLQSESTPPALIVVDEAHHAAAASYAPIFEAHPPMRALFLTATPNRTDRLPIGIDEIAFSITYRQLAERGVILRPEFEDFPVADFDWSPEQIRDLADYVIDRAADDYVKTLIIAPRIDRVEEFWRALRDRLAEIPDHPLTLDDVGFVHSEGNSLGCDTDTFLDTFTASPRGILVSAQMLLEGFDDPSINAVVVTYPTSSIIVLMQAAGRCVRYAPGKNRAFVLQARNDALAYHFDHRWLYQELSDRLRPRLIDIEYSGKAELLERIAEQLAAHNVDAATRREILRAVAELEPGQVCRLLLSGLPYYGNPAGFDGRAVWSAILETPDNSERLRAVFNEFSDLGAPTSDPLGFLDRRAVGLGIDRSQARGRVYRRYVELLTAMYWARVELTSSGAPMPELTGRPFTRHGPTTWLRYITFEYRPTRQSQLELFLDDCYNRDAALAVYRRDPQEYALALKLPMPLGGYEAHLLNRGQAGALEALTESVRAALLRAEMAEHFGVLAFHLASTSAGGLPMRVIQRIERYLTETDRDALLLPLHSLAVDIA